VPLATRLVQRQHLHGDGYNAASRNQALTGFDLYPVNLSGVTYNALQLDIYVWGNVNTSGHRQRHDTGFQQLIGSLCCQATGTFSSGFYFPFESATPGVTPGVTLTTPLTIPGTTIGITFSYQGSTDGGTTFATANNLHVR